MKSILPFVVKILTSLLAVFTNYFVAKHLGIEYFGVYSSILSLTFILNLFSDWGINLYGSQLIATAADKSKLIATGNTFKFFLGIATTVFFVLFSLFQKSHLDFYLVSIPLVFCNFLNPEWVAKGVLEPHIASLRQLLFSTLNFLFVLIAVYFNLPLNFIILIYVFNTIFSYLYFGLRYKKLSFFKINLKLPIRDFFKNTKLYFVGFLLNNLIYSLGLVLLNSFSNNLQSSIYSSYYNIFTNVAAPITIVFGIIAPIYKKGNIKTISDYYNCVMLIVILGLIFYTFNSWIYNILYPSNFEYRSDLNIFSTIYFVLFCLEQMFVFKLLLDENKKKYLNSNLIGIITLVFLWCLLLIFNGSIEAKHAMIILIICQLAMIFYSLDIKSFFKNISTSNLILFSITLVCFITKATLPITFLIIICLILFVLVCINAIKIIANIYKA